MQHIIPANLESLTHDHHVARLAGPRAENGIDSCSAIVCRLPPGGAGPKMHTHIVDQFYYVVSGELSLEIGTESFKAGPNTLIFFPKGVPHCNANKSGAEEVHLEINAPSIPKDLPVANPAEARHVPGAKDLIRPLSARPFKETREKGFRVANLVKPEDGAICASIGIGEVDPGAGTPGLHFHGFDQFYYVLEGELEVQVGVNKTKVAPHTLVILPKGMVHGHRNTGTTKARFVQIAMPGEKDAKSTTVHVMEKAS